MYEIEILDEAENDLRTAAQWYEQHNAGLGIKFLTDIDSAFYQLSYFPESGVLYSNPFRRKFLRSFPYAIYYTFEGKIVYILSILHARRDTASVPRFLKKRKNKPR